MKKRLLALTMASIMTVGCLTACGGSADTGAETPASTTTEAPAATTETPAATTETPADTTEPAAEEGKVLNIYVWNTEFASRVTEHLPGYECSDATLDDNGNHANPTADGTWNGITVKWHVTANEGNAYQDNLDSVLDKQASASGDDLADIFLVEADYALKYVDDPGSMTMADLGITDADLADQYQYTKDVVTDANGNLKGASWQACSAGLIYNREAAKDILGTDDPVEVQKAVSSWAKYNETAAAAKEKGYVMCSVADTFRTYSNNVSGKWVQDDMIVIDPNIMQWIDDSKALAESGAENTNDLWGDDWAKGKLPEGKTFCYFGPAWFFNFCLDFGAEGTIATNGGWGFCEGPQGYFWGGTWICAATGTDNPTAVKDLILTMTTDKAVLKEIAVKDSDCVNSKSVLADLATSADGNIALLGGQNPYAQLAAGAENVDLSNLSAYDQGCNEEIQKQMKDYFTGNVDKETALNNFYTAVEEKYPGLSH